MPYPAREDNYFRVRKFNSWLRSLHIGSAAVDQSTSRVRKVRGHRDESWQPELCLLHEGRRLENGDAVAFRQEQVSNFSCSVTSSV